MDTNVQALKNLYVALGGEASDVADLTTSSEVITAMESVAASAASELPAVTSSDNGKVLCVSSGKWGKKFLATNIVVTINELSGNFSLGYCPNFSEILPYVKANGIASFTITGGAFGADLQTQGGFFSGTGNDSQALYANGIFDTPDYGLCAYSIKITPDNTKTLKVVPITQATVPEA